MIIRFLKNLVNADGSWNLDMFRIWIPEKIINHIRINERSWDPKDASRSISWKYKGTQRVKFFIWLAFKQKLLANMKQVRRGIGNGSLYAICGHDSKDILHAIRDCSGAKEAWNQVISVDRSGVSLYFKACNGMLLRLSKFCIVGPSNMFLITRKEVSCEIGKVSGSLAIIDVWVNAQFFYAELWHIRQMLEVGNWFLQCIPRENNKDVDCLAKMAFDREEELVEDPPRGIPRALKLM
ncbi:hypothetical protein Goarm_014822 [Gossypium armourianum]|uniref:Reverse transcriptase zinc-binding domain-containing protein n=1 Tax=Gossypium armourianum TaxID=34283 RepID=A0A7J9J7B7_9ROSI|nr:hypothetical protein [Gossypium armourianum]